VSHEKENLNILVNLSLFLKASIQKKKKKKKKKKPESVSTLIQEYLKIPAINILAHYHVDELYRLAKSRDSLENKLAAERIAILQAYFTHNIFPVEKLIQDTLKELNNNNLSNDPYNSFYIERSSRTVFDDDYLIAAVANFKKQYIRSDEKFVIFKKNSNFAILKAASGYWCIATLDKQGRPILISLRTFNFTCESFIDNEQYWLALNSLNYDITGESDYLEKSCLQLYKIAIDPETGTYEFMRHGKPYYCPYLAGNIRLWLRPEGIFCIADLELKNNICLQLFEIRKEMTPCIIPHFKFGQQRLDKGTHFFSVAMATFSGFPPASVVVENIFSPETPPLQIDVDYDKADMIQHIQHEAGSTLFTLDDPTNTLKIPFGKCDNIISVLVNGIPPPVAALITAYIEYDNGLTLLLSMPNEAQAIYRLIKKEFLNPASSFYRDLYFQRKTIGNKPDPYLQIAIQNLEKLCSNLLKKPEKWLDHLNLAIADMPFLKIDADSDSIDYYSELHPIFQLFRNALYPITRCVSGTNAILAKLLPNPDSGNNYELIAERNYHAFWEVIFWVNNQLNSKAFQTLLQHKRRSLEESRLCDVTYKLRVCIKEWRHKKSFRKYLDELPPSEKVTLLIEKIESVVQSIESYCWQPKQPLWTLQRLRLTHTQESKQMAADDLHPCEKDILDVLHIIKIASEPDMLSYFFWIAFLEDYECLKETFENGPELKITDALTAGYLLFQMELPYSKRKVHIRDVFSEKEQDKIDADFEKLDLPLSRKLLVGAK